MPLPAMLAAAAPYVLPAVGGAVATGLGSLMSGGGGKGNFLTGSPGQTQQMQRFNPQQQQGINQVLQQALGGLQPGKFDFGPIRERALANFGQYTQPSIGERFAAMGGVGSSGYRNAMASAYGNLERDLAAQEQGFGLQQQDQLLRMLGIGLTPSFDNVYQQGQPGLAQGLSQGIGASLPQLFKLLSMYLGQQGTGTQPQQPTMAQG